jgi:hypothetical protein
VRRVDFKVGNRRARRDGRAPFAQTLSIARVDRTHQHTIRAIVRLSDGTRATIKRTLRRARR